MFQIVIIGLLLLLSYYMIQNTLGWNGTLVELPAYHTSFIRQNIRKRNAVLIRNFLTEEAKSEYDEIYEHLKEIDPNSEKDIVLNDTTLHQIDECVQTIPIMFYSDWLWKPVKQYHRVMNVKQTNTKSKHSIHCFCAIQKMDITIQNGSKSKTVTLSTGDTLLVPRISKYGCSQGTIDCFYYFK